MKFNSLLGAGDMEGALQSLQHLAATSKVLNEFTRELVQRATELRQAVLIDRYVGGLYGQRE